jgi:hypothetical protein
MIIANCHVDSTLTFEVPYTKAAHVNAEIIRAAYDEIEYQLERIEVAHAAIQEERIVNSIVQHCLTGE